MRAISLPIDSQRVQFPYAGTARAVVGWKDGKSTGEQETTSAGVPLWELDVNMKVPQFGGELRTETVAVRVPAKSKPDLPEGRPVVFEHLEVSAYLSRGDLRVNLSAAGIAGGPVQREQKAA